MLLADCRRLLIVYSIITHVQLSDHTLCVRGKASNSICRRVAYPCKDNHRCDRLRPLKTIFVGKLNMPSISVTRDSA